MSAAGCWGTMLGDECSLGQVDGGDGSGHSPRTVSGDAIWGETFWQRHRDGGGCQSYVPRGTWVLSPAPPEPRRLGFYSSHLINPGSRLCLFTAYDYYLACPILCFSSNIVSALKGNEHKGKHLTFSLLKFH